MEASRPRALLIIHTRLMGSAYKIEVFTNSGCQMIDYEVVCEWIV